DLAAFPTRRSSDLVGGRRGHGTEPSRCPRRAPERRREARALWTRRTTPKHVRGDPVSTVRADSDSVPPIRDCPRERGSFVGLQLPSRAAAPLKRSVQGAVLGLSVLAFGACSAEDKDQIGRLAMPSPASDRAPEIAELWKWSWVAAMAV